MFHDRLSPAYLAGFFDGEGTFFIGKQIKKGKEYPHASVLLSQSGEEGLTLLTEIQKRFGGRLYEHLKPGQHKATKSAYKLYWNRVEAIQLIRCLLPYLILKEGKALEVLMYLTRNGE